MMTAMMLSQMPAFTMSAIFKRPVPKTIAFGGVPTGIMKAHEQAMTIAKSGASGLMWRLSEAAATTGIIVAARAVFDVTSETKVMMVEVPVMKTRSLTPWKIDAWAPMRAATPVD